MVVAAEAVDAIGGQTLRTLGARNAIVGAARAGAVATAAVTLVVGIRVVLDGPAGAIGSLALLRRGTRHANACASRVAANAVDAIHRSALRARRACRAIGQVRRSGTGARTIAIAVHALVIGVGARDDDAAGTVCPLAFLGGCACEAQARTSLIAADAVDAEARCALRSLGARSAIGLLRLRLIASAAAIAFAGIAFIVGVGGIGDVAADAVETAAFLGTGTSLASAGADVSAAEAVDAVVGEALAGGAAWSAVVIPTNAFAVTFTAVAFHIRIELGANVPADSVCAAALNPA